MTEIIRRMIPCAAVIGALALSGCSDREAEARRVREKAEAKARADAARKEMEALPKAFKSRDFFKKNETKKVPQKPEATNTQP